MRRNKFRRLQTGRKARLERRARGLAWYALRKLFGLEGFPYAGSGGGNGSGPRLTRGVSSLAGCADAAVRAIRESGARRIVYISCEPSTLARDLARLCDHGRYTLRAVALVDMFPQTYHIESVVGLELNRSA